SGGDRSVFPAAPTLAIWAPWLSIPSVYASRTVKARSTRVGLVVEEAADALAAVDRQDGAGEQGRDADLMAVRRQGFTTLADGVGDDHLLDRAAGDPGGSPLGEDAVR